MRIDGFQPLDDFGARMDHNLRLLRQCRPMVGVERVYTPGELEWLRERERAVSGVPLSTGVVESLDALAEELGLDPVSSGARPWQAE